MSSGGIEQKKKSKKIENKLEQEQKLEKQCIYTRYTQLDR